MLISFYSVKDCKNLYYQTCVTFIGPEIESFRNETLYCYIQLIQSHHDLKVDSN